MSNRTADRILILASRLPGFTQEFDRLAQVSEQIVIFGSYAAGEQHPKSDIDILFVTSSKGFKSEYLDFITVQPEKLIQKSWLGSELANHIAAWGIWVKGDSAWKDQVFISSSALERKKIKILYYLAHLWSKRANLRRAAKLQLFEEAFLDAYRLIQLSEGHPIPPRKSLLFSLLAENRNIVETVCHPAYLGQVGAAYLNEIFGVETDVLDSEMKFMFKEYLATL